MPARYLIDSDVLIEYLRGRAQAVRFLEELDGEIYLSVITVAELYSGVKGEAEMQALERFLLAFEILPVDEPLARQAGLLRQKYHHSHGTGLADALIAACAEAYEATLVTFNRKHFPMLPDVRVPYLRG